jgi:hypothetical protein
MTSLRDRTARLREAVIPGWLAPVAAGMSRCHPLGLANNVTLYR